MAAGQRELAGSARAERREAAERRTAEASARARAARRSTRPRPHAPRRRESGPSWPPSTSSCAPPARRAGRRPRCRRAWTSSPATSSRWPPRSGRGSRPESWTACRRRARCSTPRARAAGARDVTRARPPGRPGALRGRRAACSTGFARAPLRAARRAAAGGRLARRLAGRVSPATSRGMAVTRARPRLDGRHGRAAPGRRRRARAVLEQRNRRAELVAASERPRRARGRGARCVEAAAEGVAAADAAREEADVARAAPPATGGGRRGRPPRRLADGAPPRGARRGPGRGPRAPSWPPTSAPSSGWPSTSSASAASGVARVERLRAGSSATASWREAAERAAAALDRAREAVAGRRDALESRARPGRRGRRAHRRRAARLRPGGGRAAGPAARARARPSPQPRWPPSRCATPPPRRARLTEIAGRLGLERRARPRSPCREERAELEARDRAAARRREQLGPVNPLAPRSTTRPWPTSRSWRPSAGPRGRAGGARGPDQRDRPAHPRELRGDLRGRGQELRGGGRHLFPGGRGRLRLVQPDQGPRPVLGGERRRGATPPEPRGAPSRADGRGRAGRGGRGHPGRQVQKRLSLLSGGEKSLVALAFMFAVFLARPCPFYILDEVEAALDDLNIDRFLQLVRALLRPRAVHRGHPPEAHDGRGRLACTG